VRNRNTAQKAYYRVILLLNGNQLLAHLMLADMLTCDQVLKLRELVAVHGTHRRIVVACVVVDVRVVLQCVDRV